jgi:hypothetical protein
MHGNSFAASAPAGECSSYAASHETVVGRISHGEEKWTMSIMRHFPASGSDSGAAAFLLLSISRALYISISIF